MNLHVYIFDVKVGALTCREGLLVRVDGQDGCVSPVGVR